LGAVELLTAQWALETDTGRSMYGHNFAGIKASPAAPGASFRTREGHGAERREVTARFRSYDSAEQGARDYVRLLADRYPRALDAAREGNVEGFAHALAVGGYFTAEPQAYARGLAQRLQELEGGSTSASTSSSARALAPVSEGALSGLLRSFCRDREEA
jgi:flagellar protein FlgJ